MRELKGKHTHANTPRGAEKRQDTMDSYKASGIHMKYITLALQRHHIDSKQLSRKMTMTTLMDKWVLFYAKRVR